MTIDHLYWPCLLCRKPHHKSSCSSVLRGWLIVPWEGQPLCILRSESIPDTRTWRVWKRKLSLMSLENFWKFCSSPVSCCDKVGPILCKANCLHFCWDFVTGDLEQSPFIDFPVVTCLYHETQDLDLDNECPRAQYSTSWSVRSTISHVLESNLISPPSPI